MGLDRRWATLAVAVLLGAGGGSLLGFLTAPRERPVQSLAPAEQLATSTTHRPRSRFAGISSTTRPRARPLPTVTAGRRPATTGRPTTSTARPSTSTTTPTTTTTTRPATSGTTTTTTTPGATTTTTSPGPSSSTTSTTRP